MQDSRTNVEFVRDLMEDSSQGPMAQLVVLAAIEKYVAYVTQNKEAAIEQMKNSFIYGPTWVACCEELHRKTEARYAKPATVDA